MVAPAEGDRLPPPRGGQSAYLLGGLNMKFGCNGVAEGGNFIALKTIAGLDVSLGTGCLQTMECSSNNVLETRTIISFHECRKRRNS